MTSYPDLLNTRQAVAFSLETRGVSVGRSYRTALQRILKSALGRFARRIQAIEVWLEDVNGPRGGADTRCRIKVRLRPRGQVMATSQATNEWIATSNAAFQAATLIDSRVKRARTRRRQPQRDLAPRAA